MYISSYHQNIFFAFQSHLTLPPLRKWLCWCLDDVTSVSLTEATSQKSSAPLVRGCRDLVPYHFEWLISYGEKRWRWMNNEHEPTQGLRNKTRRTVRRFTSKVFFFFFLFSFSLQCCDTASETLKGLCWGNVGGELDLWFVYTLKTFYVSLCKM